MAGTKHFYKFRSLQNPQRFIDIIVNKRLYAAEVEKLNDPMEGVFTDDANHLK